MYIQPLNIFFSASYFFVLRQCSCSCLQRKMFGCGCLMSMYSNVYSVENLLNFAKNFTVQFENVSSEISILAVVRARRHRFPRKSMSRAPADYSETMALFPRFIRDNCRRDNATFTRRRRILSPVGVGKSARHGKEEEVTAIRSLGASQTTLGNTLFITFSPLCSVSPLARCCCSCHVPEKRERALGKVQA